MDRKAFLKTLSAFVPSIVIGMELRALNKFVDSLGNTPKMPVLFLGHGSPMNAIEDNEFVQGFKKVASGIDHPKAILCISAHWETRGTKVTAMEYPETIHDFGGFPPALYQIQYPAPGSPELAKQTKDLILNQDVVLDHKWGLDHGAWTVIKHMYPKADVPVIQLSLNVNLRPAEHYELAQELSALRKKGVLIIGSGNLVHNLGKVAWHKMNEIYAYDWAKETMEQMNDFIISGNHSGLINYQRQGWELAIPTPEHYLPLLYVLALQDKGETIQLFNDKPLAGSLSMTSVKIGT